MKIIAMEATFGKLEKSVLTLRPGLNILEGENEWGKSTWCAFILAMLYGLDTRAKTTKTNLAEKERYAPWSGSPMAGRMDILWRGRYITIERSTKGRIPLGVFRAYETESGLEIPELTAANCGQLLLGAEQGVFRRAGFIRLTDLPVSEDEALRSRLNALVTTGDESGEAEGLEKGLRELKNRCRYHKNGLLPQAEGEKAALEATIEELTALEGRTKQLQQRLEEERAWQAQLDDHRLHLAYRAAREDEARVAAAREAAVAAREELARQEELCARLPSREIAGDKLDQLKTFREEWEQLQQSVGLLPREETAPVGLEPFGGMPPETAEAMVREDQRAYDKAKVPVIWLMAALVLLILAGVGFRKGWLLPAAAAAALAVTALVLAVVLGIRRSRLRKDLMARYGGALPVRWPLLLEDHIRCWQTQAEGSLRRREAREDLDRQLQQLENRRLLLCGSQTPEKMAALWQQTLHQWERLDQARQRSDQAERHHFTLRAMLKPVEKPAGEDSLTASREETEQLTLESHREQQRLQQRLGQYRGRMESLGQRAALEGQLEALEARIRKLEDIYEAASLGLQTLEEARQTLQRRFAPRITRRAQELLERLTAGRYCQLRLTRDLGLHARAEEETVLREALWRSDGTVDQLYLALRLAVAEELTPDAPLVLDDALVRFDDKRLKAALEVLHELSETKQILLFTCQSRENAMLSGKL